MSHFYKQLHDRELLAQAELVMRELQRRGLIDVFLPEADRQAHETAEGIVFPRRLDSVSVTDGKLSLVVEQSFFR
jgi:hypothetical protein